MYPELHTVQAIQRDRRRQLETQAATHRLTRTSSDDLVVVRPRRSRWTRRLRLISLGRNVGLSTNPVPRPATH